MEGALDRRWLTNDGPLVRELEERVVRYTGAKHCVAMVNGTLALEIAVRALGMTGEVIVPSYTFVATPHALSWQGITPVFADIDERTHGVDPESVRRLVTPRTTGIVAVHLWGVPAAVRELEEIAEQHGLALLFDAAHAFGAGLGSRMVGTFGDAEVFSFHATKFFNSIEGGAVLTDDDEVAHRARLMRNFGFAGEDTVVSEGTNAKMSEVCAAMGLANLGTLDDVVAVNESNYHAYRRSLEGVPGVTVLPVDGDGPRNFQYVVLVVDASCPATRDTILAALRSADVLARRYFWPGCHNMEPYRSRFPDAARHLPVTERVAESVIVLPSGTAVDADAIARVADLIRSTVAAA